MPKSKKSSSSGIVTGCPYCHKEYTDDERVRKNLDPVNFVHCKEQTAYWKEIDDNMKKWEEEQEAKLAAQESAKEENKLKYGLVEVQTALDGSSH